MLSVLVPWKLTAGSCRRGYAQLACADVEMKPCVPRLKAKYVERMANREMLRGGVDRYHTYPRASSSHVFHEFVLPSHPFEAASSLSASLFQCLYAAASFWRASSTRSSCCPACCPTSTRPAPSSSSATTSRCASLGGREKKTLEMFARIKEALGMTVVSPSASLQRPWAKLIILLPVCLVLSAAGGVLRLPAGARGRHHRQAPALHDMAAGLPGELSSPLLAGL